MACFLFFSTKDTHKGAILQTHLVIIMDLADLRHPINILLTTATALLQVATHPTDKVHQEAIRQTPLLPLPTQWLPTATHHIDLDILDPEDTILLEVLQVGLQAVLQADLQVDLQADIQEDHQADLIAVLQVAIQVVLQVPLQAALPVALQGKTLNQQD